MLLSCFFSNEHAEQGAGLLLSVSCAGMGKQSAGKGFKMQVGEVEAEIRQQQI